MTSEDILFERFKHRRGDIINAPKLVKGDSVQTVRAEIIEMYPWHVLVQDEEKNGEKPKYKWCVCWVDLMRMGEF